MELDLVFAAVLGEVRALGIPLSPSIEPHVEVNRRAVTRFGCCHFRGGRFYIEVAERVALGPERALRETLAHEALHTCPGCRNHGKRWREYARRMNEAYGYHIARTSTGEELGVGEAPREPKYLLRCTRCGAEFPRFRASPLTRRPERYRCKCGGRLERVR